MNPVCLQMWVLIILGLLPDRIESDEPAVLMFIVESLEAVLILSRESFPSSASGTVPKSCQ